MFNDSRIDSLREGEERGEGGGGGGGRDFKRSFLRLVDRQLSFPKIAPGATISLGICFGSGVDKVLNPSQAKVALGVHHREKYHRS